jgi:hypothetical protein
MAVITEKIGFGLSSQKRSALTYLVGYQTYES